MYELQVEGVSCNHCVSKLTRSVRDVDATAKVEVDLESGKLRVESKAELDDIVSAVFDAGYAVTG